jgi:hypothetical protein
MRKAEMTSATGVETEVPETLLDTGLHTGARVLEILCRLSNACSCYLPELDDTAAAI